MNRPLLFILDLSVKPIDFFQQFGIGHLERTILLEEKNTIDG